MLPLLKGDKTIFILAGTGNNGGDAIVLAHLLKKDHFSVQLCLVERPKSPLAIEKLAYFCKHHGLSRRTII